MRPIAANILSSAEVRSPAGEDVGKIVDFMLDTERGSVEYAVMAVGGVLGVGAKMLAIPPETLRLSGDRRCLELSVDTAALDATPGIDRANPPETADAARLVRTSAGPASARRNRG
jgi:sporulation protein YlmC with PRC-barrel domain